MLIDSRGIDQDSAVTADLCIIGGGAAGITVARACRSAGFSVTLLESGGLSYDERSQALYEGSAHGPLFRDRSRYLTRSRVRYFVGSTNHWAGYCRPLDDIDFAQRAWVPHSGWPITRRDLEAYHEPAAELLQIAPFAPVDEGLGEDAPSGLFPSRSVLTKRFHVSPTQFGSRYREDLARAEDVAVYLYANATRLETNEAGSRVEQIRVATLSGNRFTVAARYVVLSTGGIENARLLLLSNGVQKNGLGNEHDLVGRFFMDHSGRSNSGQMIVTRPLSEAEADAYFTNTARLCLSEPMQREHRLLNASVRLYLREVDEVSGPAERVGRALMDLAHLGDPPPSRPVVRAACGVVTEQTPNPNSRVTLAGELDELGSRRATLDWKASLSDAENMRKTLEVLGAELGRAGHGRVRVAPTNPDDPWRGMDYDLHHMGTTRMSASPSLGVVNSDCRVHDLANLYISSSSVFPTSGFANPTFTIVVLALRLAAHLRREVRRG